MQAEAEACVETLTVAPDWGISRIHVETDDQQLVHALANHNQDLSRNGMVFKEIRSLALLNFNTSNNKKKKTLLLL